MSVRYTTREAAKIMRASPEHVRDLIDAGDLRATDISLPGAKRKSWRIDEAELERWLDSRTTQPARPERRRSRPAKYVPTYF